MHPVTVGERFRISDSRAVSTGQKPVICRILQKIPCSQAKSGRDRFAHDCSHHHPVFGLGPLQE